MAFTHTKNVALASAPAFMLDLKTKLKAAGWTVIDSGDGEQSPSAVNGIYGAGSDILTVASTSGFYVANNIANYKAWYRIMSPAGAGGVELLVYHSASNPGSDNFGFILVPVSTGAPWPGANCAAYGVPPSDCLMIPWGTSTNALTGSNLIADQQTQPVDDDGATARHCDYAFGDATEGYAFYAFTRTAARRAYRGVALDYIKGSMYPADSVRYVFAYFYSNTSNATWASHLGSALTSWGPYSGHNTSGENGSNPSTFATCEGEPFIHEADYPNRRGRLSHCILDLCDHSQSPTGGGFDMGLNPYDGEADILEGSCWYYRSGYPEDFTGRGSPQFPGIKGRSTLFHRGLGGVNDMTVAAGLGYVAQGSGRFWLPWDATAPTDPGGGAITASLNVNLWTFANLDYSGLTAEISSSQPAEPFMSEGDWDAEMISLEGESSSVLNRVWDDSVGRFVSWRTAEPDTLGASYPGPGTFGVDTSDYCIEADE